MTTLGPEPSEEQVPRQEGSSQHEGREQHPGKGPLSTQDGGTQAAWLLPTTPQQLGVGELGDWAKLSLSKPSCLSVPPSTD